MTIHKSQGSQADEVTVLLPPEDSRLLTRELFYTAVTRAKTKVRVVGSEAAVRAAIGRRAVRASGLRQRLKAGVGSVGRATPVRRIAVRMIDNDGSAPASRRGHILRLAVFAAFLLGMFYLVAIARVIDVEDVRRTVSATGSAAPVTYVVLSAALGALFVPGSILAAGSGLLFGPLLGIVVTLGATVGTAIVASLVGRRAGRNSARALLGADTRRAHRRVDRTPRTVGGRRSALRPGHLGCAGLVRVRGVRGSRCGRWRSARSSGPCRGLSPTPRWAPRSRIGRRGWLIRRSRCGA